MKMEVYEGYKISIADIKFIFEILGEYLKKYLKKSGV